MKGNERMAQRLIENQDREEERAEKRKRLYRRLLFGFFGCMLIFTVLSRIIDAYEVPKVEFSLPSPSMVIKTVEGMGVVEAGEEKSVRVMEGLLAGKIAAKPGAEVKAGEPLFYYDGFSMAEKQKKLLKEIKSLELKMEEERRGAVSYEGVSKTELAAQELDAADRALSRQQEETREAELEHDENLLWLKDYYEKRLALSDEELMNQSRNDFDKSANDYETAQVSRESELKSIKRKIQDTKKKLEKLEEKEADGEDTEKIEELTSLLEQYEEDLDAASEKWDLALSQAEDDRNDKEDILRRARKEMSSAKLALKENYENAVKQEEKNLKAAVEEEEKYREAASAAALLAENAKRDDRAEKLTEEQKKQLSELRCQDIELDLDEKREELRELKELILAGGAAAAPCDGVVTLSEVEQGKKLTGGERFLLSSGTPVFKGSFDRSTEGTLGVGDEVEVKLEGEEKAAVITAGQVDLITDEETGTFTGAITGKAALGAKGTFKCVKRTELFNTVIPVKSLRKDMTGYFCLVLRPYKTILGEEYRAARVDVKLLYRGDSMAAVEGPLMSEDMVIGASDRVVNAGDRVRPVTDAGGK